MKRWGIKCDAESYLSRFKEAIIRKLDPFELTWTLKREGDDIDSVVWAFETATAKIP